MTRLTEVGVLGANSTSESVLSFCIWFRLGMIKSLDRCCASFLIFHFFSPLCGVVPFSLRNSFDEVLSRETFSENEPKRGNSPAARFAWLFSFLLTRKLCVPKPATFGGGGREREAIIQSFSSSRKECGATYSWRHHMSNHRLR